MPRLNVNPQQSSDRVPEDFAKKVISEIENYSKHDDFRKKVKEIFADCIKDIDFVKTIKIYASEEIDRKLYQSVGFWVKTVIIPIAVAVLTILVAKWLKLT